MLQATTRFTLFWIAVITLLLLFIWLVHGILLPFVLGIGIAYFLDPVADRLERHMPRNAATLLIITVFFLLLIGFLLAFAPMLVNQLTGLMAELPNYVQKLQQLLQNEIHRLPPTLRDEPQDALASIPSELVGYTGQVFNRLLRSGLALVNLVALLFLTPIVAFYLLRDWDKVVMRFHELLPRQHAATISGLLNDMDRTLSGFIRGQVNVCLILGAFYAIGLSFAGLRYGVVVGLITGLLAFVPYLGAWGGGLLAIGMAFAQFDDNLRILLVAGIYLLGQALEGNILSPKIIGDKVGVHPLWLIFGMLAGGAIFGFVGVLLAVPVTAMLSVLVRYAVSRYEGSQYYNEAKAKQPPAAPPPA